MIIQRVSDTEFEFLHWLEDTDTGETSSKVDYTRWAYLKGMVGFTAYYSDKEGILPSDDFCKMIAYPT